MEIGSRIHMDNMVAKSHATVAMKGNVLVVIEMRRNVKVMSSFMERKIVKEIGLFLMVENMVVGNRVVSVINGRINKETISYKRIFASDVLFNCHIKIDITNHNSILTNFYKLV